MVFCQKMKVFTMWFFWWADQARLDRFLIFWIEKNVFFDQKSDVTKKVQKNEIFQGG